MKKRVFSVEQKREVLRYAEANGIVTTCRNFICLNNDK